jgi:hypothetical protein
LVNRRAAIRMDNNIFDEGGALPLMDTKNFNSRDVVAMNSQLDAADRAGLELVAQKLVDVQAGAMGQGTAIQVVMPEHGQEFVFRRTLQNELGGELVLRFTAGYSSAWKKVFMLWPIVPGCAVIWLMMGMCFGFKKNRNR